MGHFLLLFYDSTMTPGTPFSKQPTAPQTPCGRRVKLLTISPYCPFYTAAKVTNTTFQVGVSVASNPHSGGATTAALARRFTRWTLSQRRTMEACAGATRTS